MNSSISSTEGSAAAVYFPGYAKAKLLMAVGGMLVAAIGFVQIWTSLRLVLFGQHIQAEVVRVIKTKRGVPDVTIANEVQLQASLEERDRSYIFWNEFRFQTPEHRFVDVRASVGGQLKPLYSLIDSDGLPTTDLVCYDPTAPEKIIFPLIVSTWLAPGSLVFAGLACAFIGAVLLYWSNKPIELPHIPAPESHAIASYN